RVDPERAGDRNAGDWVARASPSGTLRADRPSSSMFFLLLSLALLFAPPRAAAVPCDAKEAAMPTATAASVASTQGDPIARLRTWLKLAHEGRAAIDKRSLEDLKNSISDLRTLWAI